MPGSRKKTGDAKSEIPKNKQTKKQILKHSAPKRTPSLKLIQNKTFNLNCPDFPADRHLYTSTFHITTLLHNSLVMCCMKMFQSMTDCIYDRGPTDDNEAESHHQWRHSAVTHYLSLWWFWCKQTYCAANRIKVKHIHLCTAYYIILDNDKKWLLLVYVLTYYMFYHYFREYFLVLMEKKKTCCKTVSHVMRTTSSYVSCLLHLLNVSSYLVPDLIVCCAVQWHTSL